MKWPKKEIGNASLVYDKITRSNGTGYKYLMMYEDWDLSPNKKNVVSPESAPCSSCQFMIKGACQWGYKFLCECVFKRVGVCDDPVRENNKYDSSRDGPYRMERNSKGIWVVNVYRKREDLLEAIECGLKKEKSEGVKGRYEYLLWQFKYEPCVICGKIAEHYSIISRKRMWAHELEFPCSQAVKICKDCTDNGTFSNWW